MTAPSTSSPWRWLGLLLTPAAVVLALLLALQTGNKEAERLKGMPAIEFITRDGISVVDVRPGTKLTLKLATAGFTHALALAVDDSGGVEQLWPEPGKDDALPGGSPVALPRELEAPLKPVTVHVLLSNAPIDAVKAKADVPAALKTASALTSKRLLVSP